MRILVLSRIYRAFPELDRYADEPCERFVRAARRHRWYGWVGVVALFGFIALVTVGLALVTAAFLMSRFEVPPARFDSSAVPTLLTLLGVVVVLGLGFGGAYVLRDWLLRRRIAYVLRARGVCAGCHYSLVGLPVGAGNRVHCPECAMESEVDPSLGELVVDGAGQARFQPKPAEPGRVARWLTPVRRRRLKRAGIALAILVPLVIGGGWGLFEYSLRRQAARATAIRPGLAGLEAVQAKFAFSNPADPEPGEQGNAWTYLTEAGLAIEQAWANAQPAVPEVDATGQTIYADWSMAWPVPEREPTETDGAPVDNEGLARRKAEGVLSTRMFEQLDRAPIDELLREAMAAPSSRWALALPANQPLLSVQLAQMGKPRQLARYAAARVRRAIAKGDHAEAVDGIEVTLMLARLVSRQPFLIAGLVAAAIENMAVGEIRLLLAAKPTAETLDALEAALERQHYPNPARYGLETEQTASRDTVAWIFADPDRVRRGVMSPAVQQMFGSTPSGRLGSLEENLAAFDRYFARVLSEAAKPAHARQTLNEPDTGLALVDTLKPSVSRTMFSFDLLDLGRDGIRTLIALERYRLAKGEYPERLDQLVPAFLGAVPVDPFSGMPFGYARIAGGGTAADQRGVRPFVLYAPGVDKQDDKGKASNDEVAAIREGARPGADYLFNPEGDYVTWP